MIDAPDHAAQERDNRSTGAWLLVALLGIALSVVAGMMSYGYTTAQAEQRLPTLSITWRRRAFPTMHSIAPIRPKT